jgi:hypothetical protein
MKPNPKWGRAVAVVSAFVATALVLRLFFGVRNVLVYAALTLAAAYLANKRMKARETPFEREERLARRMRM